MKECLLFVYQTQSEISATIKRTMQCQFCVTHYRHCYHFFFPVAMHHARSSSGVLMVVQLSLAHLSIAAGLIGLAGNVAANADYALLSDAEAAEAGLRPDDGKQALKRH